MAPTPSCYNRFMIDTHCHVHDFSTYTFVAEQKKREASDFTPEKLLERSFTRGITGVICIGTSHDDSLVAQKFANQHEGVFWSYGVHPDEAKGSAECFGAGLAACEGRLEVGSKAGNPPVAIGEVGLDYHNSSGNREAQIRLFEQMLELAQALDLPLIFHVREAFDDFFPIVDNFHVRRAVVHSFSDSLENLEKALARDFYVGVNGLATFAHELPIAQVPLERLLLETDAPFLAPTPHRKEVNEPFYVRGVAEFLAKMHGCSADEIVARADENAKSLFAL